MKRWGLVVVGLYFVVLVALSFPVAFAAFWPKESAREMFRMYGHWVYWIWILVMVCGELLLLFVPIRYDERRPKSRRPLLAPIITSSLFFGLLMFLFRRSVVFSPPYAYDGYCFVIRGYAAARLPIVRTWLII